MRVGGANYVITRGWRQRSALALEAGDVVDNNYIN